MAAAQKGTTMVEPPDDPYRGQGAIYRATRPSPEFRMGGKSPINQESLRPGDEVSLTVFPRYFLRRFPWLAQGFIFSNNEAGVSIVRTIHGFGKPFKAAYFIPASYFEEGRVFNG